jgi:hypothetical protein
MNSRTLGILAAVTALLLAAAIVAYISRAPEAVGPTDAMAFDDLLDRANDVTRLVVDGADGSVTIERRGETWSIAEKGGYPARFETVKEAIMGLADLRLVEPKTDDPQQYAKLGVENPTDEDAQSVRVTLQDGSEQVIASLVVGQRAGTAGRQSRRYVRREGEARSWLARGTLEVQADPLGWLDRQIMRLGMDRIASVSVTHPDGECLLVSRPSAEQRNFDVADVPDDRELRYDGAANPIASALSFLSLDDVMPRGDLELPDDEVTVAEYRTFDGLVITARTIQRDETAWVVISATTDPEILAAAAAPAEPEDETVASPKSSGSGPEAVLAEAGELDDQLGPWAFALGASAADNLRKRMNDLTEVVEELEPEIPAVLDPEPVPVPLPTDPPTTDEPGGPGP